MKKFVYLLPILFVSSVSAQVLGINQFSGINTDGSPLTLQNGQSPDSRNIVTDDDFGVQGRTGFILFSTEPSSGLFEFPLSNGTRYLITRSGGNLKATTDGIFSVLIGTVPTDRIVAAAVLGDKFFFSDTLNGLKYWDGATVTTSSRTLTFDKLVTFKGRLVGAGKSGSERVLYLSKYLDGTTFALATNPSDDDPAQLTVSGSLDEIIQAFYSTFQDKLIYFKKNSFGGLSGSRRSNFALRVYSDSIGVSSVETIRDCNGKLRWLGNNRKIYQFDGATFGTISEDIDNIFASVSQGDANSRVFSYTTQSDWASATVDSVYGDTITVAGSLALTFPDLFDSMRDGTLGTKPVWDIRSIDAFSAPHTGVSVTGGNLSLVSSNDTLIYALSRDTYSNYKTGTTYYITLSSISAKPPLGGSTFGSSQFSLYIGKKTPFVADPVLRFSFSPQTPNGSALNLEAVAENGVNVCPASCNASSGTIPASLVIFVDTSTFRVTVGTGATTSGSLTASVAVSTNIALVYSSQDGGIGNSGTCLLGDFAVSPQTMTYTSSAIDLGSNISAYAAFNVNQTGSSIGYKFNSSSNSSASLFISTSFTGISSGQIPTNTVKRYAVFTSTFASISSATVSLNAIDMNTTEGSTVRAASSYIGSRYWLGLAISSTSNNSVLVYDKKNQWQRYNGYVPEVMSIYNSRMYVGNTNGIFLSESSYADNGTPITAYYTTKTFAPAGFDFFGQYDHLYLTTDNSDDTLTPTFQINNNGTDNSLGSSAMNGTLGAQNLKYPFSFADVQEGKFINFKLSSTGISFWRINNGNLYFTPSANPD